MTNEQFNKQENTGLRHLVNATRFSIQGLSSAFTNEAAFRQELLLILLVLPTGAWFATSLMSFIALFCACLLVLVVELLNSGIEAAIDRIGPEHHELSGLAKDFGSAAVMLTLVIMIVIWLYIIYSGTFAVEAVQ
jgi:diacylglycerol kinase (ATP)